MWLGIASGMLIAVLMAKSVKGAMVIGGLRGPARVLCCGLGGGVPAGGRAGTAWPRACCPAIRVV